jgi:UDP-2,3-diacylglucosamine pyrophosphatase LpxH
LATIDRIHSSLTKLNSKCHQLDLDINNDKWIIFSDHHRGVGDGADDFAPCKQNYLAALEDYLEKDYGLIILGDAEEFWENTLKSVITKYKDVLEVEKKFHQKNQLLKVWGNHDDAWNHISKVSHHLFPFFNNIATHEAIKLNVIAKNNKLGDMLLVHGHQGSGASDKFAGISRWFVRVIWRNMQRWFKIPLSTPAKSKKLKDKHDIAMHTWAKQLSKQIVICGHTHQPVFMSKNHLDILVRELEGLDHDNPDNSELIANIMQKITKLKKKTTAIGTLVADSKPCYFNSGCCSFADGDITGLEISSGEIRLVKWSEEKLTIIGTEKIEEIYKML